MRLDSPPKQKFLFLITTGLCVYCVYLYVQYIHENRYFEEWRLLRLSLNGTNQCHLPLTANPFDASVDPYIVKLKDRIECPKSYANSYYSVGPNGKSLTVVDESGILVTTETKEKLWCVYKNFSRKDGNDDQLQYSSEKQLPQKLDLKALNMEFVAVKCFKEDNLVYTNTHFYPLLQNKPEALNQPSVIVLVIESLSRLNYLRFLKQTRHAFESLGSHFYLKGLTKMADNSFPNMAPLLTGLRTSYNEFPPNVDEGSGPYDDLPLIWKRFARLNYTTAFIEDYPELTLFNYLSKGFLKKPTDWYPRPFWLHVYQELDNIIQNHCYKSQPKIELFLHQIKQFINIKKSKPVFLYAFFIEVTHHDFNKAQLVDYHYAKFINEYNSYLKNSIFILMGDHGSRFGAFVETPLGRIEERMPLFALHLPEALLAERPHLSKYININSERLTTWLDVHQLLVDISESNFREVRSLQRKRQYSIWREEIPSDRTCEEALIPEYYCVCDDRIEVNVSEPFVVEAGQSLIAHINGLLSSNTKQCTPLVVDRIKSAWAIFANNRIQQSKRSERKIEVIISAAPSNAIFSGLLYKNYWSSKWTVSGDVSRLNKYGDQSKCIDHKILKKFCYCKM